MSYAGDLSPEETWDRLAGDPEAVLVDVRTREEWAEVGVPDLTTMNKDVVTIEWLQAPFGIVNASFLDELAAAGIGQDTPVHLLCRSGVRSVAAAEAATAAGWTKAYNVTQGFEGAVGPAGERDVDGWRNAGLPWRRG